MIQGFIAIFSTNKPVSIMLTGFVREIISLLYDGGPKEIEIYV